MNCIKGQGKLLHHLQHVGCAPEVVIMLCRKATTFFVIWNLSCISVRKLWGRARNKRREMNGGGGVVW